MPVDSGIAISSSELGPGFKEGPEYCFRVLEVVVDDVHEVTSTHELRDELSGRRVGIVKLRPLLAKFISLVLGTVMRSSQPGLWGVHIIVRDGPSMP